MAHKEVLETAKKIKNLKIQGASAVRRATVSAVKKGIVDSRAKTVSAFRAELRRNMKTLLVRPTEPETRTALRIILKAANEKTKLAELKKHVLETITGYEKNRKLALENIAEKGAKVFGPEGNSIVMTHCHSHTVMAIIKKARAKGKVKRVIVTESRPLFQGRISAAELAKAGIPVTLIVDSAAATYLKKADIFIAGADAILADGSVVNKIGTAGISLAAKKEFVPVYFATSTHKFDPLTYFGKKERIEMRSSREVWDRKPKGVAIKNPAFDITDKHYAKGIICEKGVFTPNEFVRMVYKEFGLAGTKAKKFVSLNEMINGGKRL